MGAPGPATTWLLGRLFMRAADRGFHTRFGERARAELESAARELYAAHRGDAPDAAGRYHVAVSCWVIAANQALLERGVSQQESIALLKNWLTDAYAQLLAPPMRIVLAIIRRPYGAIARMIAFRGFDRLAFGRGFAFSSARRERTAELVVHRCLYHDFFAARGVPELTQVICHSDHAWIDVLDPSRQRMRFERPSTLGYGGAQCVFRFVKEDGAKGQQ